MKYMKMNKYTRRQFACLLVFVWLTLPALSAESDVRKVTLLEEGWKFVNKEVKNATSVNLDDSDWETVTVPHDWAITKTFDMNLDMQRVQVVEDGETEAQLRTGRTGALGIFGVGWYCKELTISEADRGKKIFVEFDGAMSHAQVYLNGEWVGEWPYGYTSFSFELTDKIRLGARNVLSVRLENRVEISRWYTGAGLFRNVRLVTLAPVHVAHWGTFVTTPLVSSQKAEVEVKTTVCGMSNLKGNVKLVTEILDQSGKKVAETTSVHPMNDSLSYHQKLRVKSPHLWDVSSPYLYSAVSRVYVDGRMTDRYVTTFGIRSLRFTADKGFFLNGSYLKMKGVCLHHDLGPIGAAVNVRAIKRQLSMLKEMGCNAIRTAHNPPSPEFLQLTDSMGFVVQVEAFDEWKSGKNLNGYQLHFDRWAEKDLRAMVRRDRNHPSVIMWSIGNEVREQKMPEGREIARFLSDICHQEDHTRPTTAGFNYHKDAIANGLAEEVDLVGLNYKPHEYANLRKKYPHYKLYGSETVAAFSSRGVYKFPVKENGFPWYTDYQISSYDLEHARWSSTPDKELAKQADCDFVMGEFVWTGFDYLGEPTPYNEGTPARSSYYGIIDLAGLKKDRFYLYQSVWSENKVLHLLPHWDWDDRLGQTVPVYCYTNYPKVELFINGVSQGIREKNPHSTLDRYRLRWNEVVYSPGEIKAVALDVNNHPVEEKIIRTSGAPYQVRLTPESTLLKADGKDLVYVTLEVLDKEGNLCPRDNSFLFASVSGAGKLKAMCNGDPTDQTSFASNYMRTFSGKLVIVIQSSKEEGDIELKVMGGKLKGTSLAIRSQK